MRKVPRPSLRPVDQESSHTTQRARRDRAGRQRTRCDKWRRPCAGGADDGPRAGLPQTSASHRRRPSAMRRLDQSPRPQLYLSPANSTPSPPRNAMKWGEIRPDGRQLAMAARGTGSSILRSSKGCGRVLALTMVWHSADTRPCMSSTRERASVALCLAREDARANRCAGGRYAGRIRHGMSSTKPSTEDKGWRPLTMARNHRR